MNIEFRRKRLDHTEADQIIKEIESIPDITFIPKYLLQRIDMLIEVNDSELLGICGIIKLGNKAVKLGPILVCKKYRGKNIGSQLLDKALSLNIGKMIYVGSSNEKLKGALLRRNFISTRSRGLPLQVKLFFAAYLLLIISPKVISEAIRKKKQFGSRSYEHFILSPHYVL